MSLPPSSVDSRMLAATWKALSGGGSSNDEGVIRGWLARYDGLDANKIAGVIGRIYERELAKGRRITSLKYFSRPIGEANHQAKQSRPEGVLSPRCPRC